MLASTCHERRRNGIGGMLKSVSRSGQNIGHQSQASRWLRKPSVRDGDAPAGGIRVIVRLRWRLCLTGVLETPWRGLRNSISFAPPWLTASPVNIGYWSESKLPHSCRI